MPHFVIMSMPDRQGDKKMKIGTIDELAIKENHEIEQILNVLTDKIRSAKRNK